MNTNRLIHAGFWFGRSDVKEAVELAKAGIGGFCIYFGTTAQVKELTETLQDAAPHKLIISADYEYGLGRWHKDAPLLPSNISLGSAAREDFAYKKGYLTALHAKSIGVNWVLAPDLDLADTPQNPIVNTRSFGANPKNVAKLGKAFMLGLEDGGVLNTLKHFPGHGATMQDSHLALPVINKTLRELEENELVPFRELLTKADSVMMAHLMIPSLDGKMPASFSPKIIEGYLRKHLHYKGLVVTDALIMKATGGLDPLDCLRAGADVLLCPDNPFELMQRLEFAVREDKTLVPRAISALSAQELLLAKLNSFVHVPPKEEIGKDSLSEACAQNALSVTGAPVNFSKRGVISYMEADIYPSREYQANAFLDELKAQGYKVKPYEEGAPCTNLVITTFANYAAFSGHINFTKEQFAAVQKAFKCAKKSVLVSFGSPFVNLELKGLGSFVFAGTQSAAFQAAAARVIGGAQANGIALCELLNN